jgi:Protein of unknown function (DUF1499)
MAATLISQRKQKAAMIRSTTIPEPMALWCRRVGLFALVLVVVALILHRFGQLTTPVGLALTAVGFALSGLALLLGLYAGTSIWVRGRSGAGRMAVGMIAAGVLWLAPLAQLPTFLALPPINDITTDTVNPPRFQQLAIARGTGTGANSPNYGGERVARLQANAYADLRSLVVVDRPADEVFDLARRVASGRKGLGWKVLAEEPPAPRKPGIIEATERTTLLGFVDDIVVRVTGSDAEARVDVRSASRFGRHDFGANASRIRRFLRELQSRLEATPPGSVAARGGPRAAVAVPKRPLPAGKAPVTKAKDGKSGPVPKSKPRKDPKFE